MVAIRVSYTQAREMLDKLLDEVAENGETVIIQRKEGDDVAMIAAGELSSLLETVYILRSPANAQRLLTALNRALKGEGSALSMDQLYAEVDFDPETA